MDESGARTKTVLVADDAEDMRLLLRTFLEVEGYRVIVASDGEEAVELASRERPDVILMDLNMPVMDGIEAVRLIRQQPALAGVPIIANSAHGDFGMSFSLRDEEFGPGFTFYITKPFDTAELREMLDRVLRPA